MKKELLLLVSKLITTPGVYIFKDKRGQVLYVGKSINVRDRVKQHISSPFDKAKAIIENSSQVEAIPVASELEALLVEAKLIHKHLPRYNSAAKDDKHPLYIKITKEVYPKVVTSRKDEDRNAIYYGPFPSTAIVRSVLKQVRRVFPFHSYYKIGQRPCLYFHLGLCHPCPGQIEQVQDPNAKNLMKAEYKKNIQKILGLFSGKSKSLQKELGKEMKQAVKSEDFEAAARIRDQIKHLEYITMPYKNPREYLENPNLLEDVRDNETKTLHELLSPHFKYLKYPRRIECFDVSHLSGKNATSSMVTFIDGEPDKNFYRNFRIRATGSHDDYLMIKETLMRRFAHFDDWGKPNLIVIDGGKGQVAAACLVLKEMQVKIPVIGLAKRLEEIVVPKIKLAGIKEKASYGFVVFRLPAGSAALSLLQRMRDEAHRFARRYHFKLRVKSLDLDKLKVASSY